MPEGPWALKRWTQRYMVGRETPSCLAMVVGRDPRAAARMIRDRSTIRASAVRELASASMVWRSAAVSSRSETLVDMGHLRAGSLSVPMSPILRQTTYRMHQIALPMRLQPQRQVATVLRRWHGTRAAAHHLSTRRLQLALELLSGQLLSPVDHREQLPQRLAQPLPIGPIPRIGQRRQILHIANQVRQTKLEQHSELALVATIGREVVTA